MLNLEGMRDVKSISSDVSRARIPHVLAFGAGAHLGLLLWELRFPGHWLMSFALSSSRLADMVDNFPLFGGNQCPSMRQS